MSRFLASSNTAGNIVHSPERDTQPIVNLVHNRQRILCFVSLLSAFFEDISVAPTMLAGTRLGASGSRVGSRALAARGTVLCVGPRQRSWAGCASAPLNKSQTSRFSVGAQRGPTRLGNT